MRPATEQRQRERAIASITLETDDDSVRRAITPTSPAVARRLAVGPRADHDQGAEPVIFEPDVEVHPVDPDVNASVSDWDEKTFAPIYGADLNGRTGGRVRQPPQRQQDEFAFYINEFSFRFINRNNEIIL